MANAVFSSTIDYEFQGGGSVIISANGTLVYNFSLLAELEAITVPQPNLDFSGSIDYFANSFGTVLVSANTNLVFDLLISSNTRVLIEATSSNNNLDFVLASSGKYKPINGILNSTIDFSVFSTVEFGIQSFAFANTRIEFSSTSEGFAPIKVSVDYILPFVAQSTITQFSLAFANTSFDFSVDSQVLNYSLQIVDLLGLNSIELITYEFNEIEVLNENNFVEIIDSGYNEAKVLTH
jgi:hypothetical protein